MEDTNRSPRAWLLAFIFVWNWSYMVVGAEQDARPQKPRKRTHVTASLRTELQSNGGFKKLTAAPKPLMRREPGAAFSVTHRSHAVAPSEQTRHFNTFRSRRTPSEISALEIADPLSCPGDWREKINIQKPSLCASKNKLDSCDWGVANRNLGVACNTSCFCNPREALQNLYAVNTSANGSDDDGEEDPDTLSPDDVTISIHDCKKMCKEEDPCYFTFISDDLGQQGECKIYTDCSSTEHAPSSTGEAGNESSGIRWTTCERFSAEFTQLDTEIALFGVWQNRFALIDCANTISSSWLEMDVALIAKITLQMRFRAVNTTDVAKMDLIGAQTTEEEKTINAEVKASEEGDPTNEVNAAQRYGGPGIIALYNSFYSHLGNGPWMTMQHDGTIRGEAEVTEHAMYKVCYMGPNHIALHNRGRGRYVVMNDAGVEASAQLACCKPPTSLIGANLTVVRLPRAAEEEVVHQTPRTSPCNKMR